MLEGRMASFEGAEACRATATGMAAVTAAVMAPVRAGDHVVAASAFGSCRYIIEDHLPRYGVETTLVEGTDLEAWRKAVRPNTKLFFLESPSNPTLEVLDIAAVAKVARRPAPSCRRQRLRHAALPAPARARRRSRRLFRDQAYRRPGPLPRRADPRLEGLIEGDIQNYLRQTGPSLALQRLGDAEGAGDAALRVAKQARTPRRSPTGWRRRASRPR
jgi:O-succinylhomoserine sulfhydrylase